VSALLAAALYWIVLIGRCLEILRQIQCSVSKRSQFAEAALSRLYDVQLTAKYAYTGFLGSRLLFLFKLYIVNIIHG